MKKLSIYSLILLMVSCNAKQMNQSDLKNEKAKQYAFLSDMYKDDYFPNHLVKKGEAILIDLCFKIELNQPQNLDDLYLLTHSATNRFNELAIEFDANDSEIETAARETIAVDFEFISKIYGFEDADIEEVIATREW